MQVPVNSNSRAVWLVFIAMVANLFLPVLSLADKRISDDRIEMDTQMSLELKLTPTSIEVTPANLSVVEGSEVVSYKAVAKFDYPGADPVIPEQDVTADALTVWESSYPSVALVDTLGRVTPVSDLNQGSATSVISATYGGIEGQATIVVTGTVTPPPGSGGGGGGSSYNPPSDDETPPGDEENPPSDEETPPTGGENPPAGGETPPAGEETPPSGGDNPPAGDEIPPAGGDELPSTGGEVPVSSGGDQIPTPPGGIPQVPGGDVLPITEVFTPDELTLKPDEIGTTRYDAAVAIADGLNVFELKKDLLGRCYKDLPNCTSIFRMFSQYNGINLNPKKLMLFPDTMDLPQPDKINNLALLGIVQGYYGIEQSPFLPEKPILRIEALKILATTLDNLEMAKPGYKAGDYPYSALFYQEVYAASLLSKLNQNQVAYAGLNGPMWLNIRLAHALSGEAWELIKAQQTPFIDVRPDLYDAHWYYPIVLDKLCGEGILECKKGSKLDPDSSPSSAQLDDYIDLFRKFIQVNQIDLNVAGDQDKDGIFNIDENQIYLTDPLVADTDEDQLRDGEEVNRYKTNPINADTDDDGLTDGVEIKKHKTNPVLYDTDADSFSDGIEVDLGSDPLNPKSTPNDKNGNKVADEWELQFNIAVADGSQDTDGDGLSDLLEFQNKSNPNRIDSDMDGYTDAEEILELQSDPNDPDSPGDVTDLPVAINNFQYGQIVADSSPMIRGVGPASLGDNIVTIQILLRNEFGAELMLGETITDAKGRFLYEPTIEIKNGTYFLLARSLNKGQVQLSAPLKIIIDNTLAVASARPERIEEVPVTDEVIIKKLVLKVDSADGRPVLYGTLSEFGSRVNVTWQSLVVSSALIADATDGSFSVKAPKLEPGRHTVYLQTVRKEDNALGKTIKINFDLKVVGMPKGSAIETKATVQTVAADVMRFVSEQTWPFWVGILAIVVLVGGAFYFFILGDEDRRKKK